MVASRTTTGAISYRSTRLGAKASCNYDYTPEEELAPAATDSLEFFLIERYRLYAAAPDRLWRGAVAHEPYPLCRAQVTAWDENLIALDGFAITGRAPDHAIMSRGVEVAVFPLQSL